MQKIESRIPPKGLGLEPAAALRSEGKPVKVLLINADQTETYLISKMIAEAGAGAFALEYTDKLSVGLERLARGDVAAFLLDLSVPDSHGIDSLAWVRTQAMDIPMVVLSSLDDEADKTKALKSGARDYLVKGRLNGKLLVRSLNHAIALQRSATQAELKTPPSEPAEAYFNNIIKNNPDGIIIVDQRGKVIFVNPAVESIFGCKPEQLLGESLDFLRAVEGGKTELSIVHKDGKNHTAEIKVAEMKYLGETAYLTSLRDITERKQVEEEAKSARQEAEQVKAAWAKVVARANEEAAATRNDAEQAKATSAKATAKANEEAAIARQEAEQIKAESAIAIAKAHQETETARQEAAQVKAASLKAIAKANEEAGIAREETEQVKTTSAKAVAKARAEAETARQEAEQIKAASTKAAAKANEETASAGEEAAQVKTAAAKTVAKSREEVAIARQEAEQVKAASAKAIAKAREETETARNDAEQIKTTSAIIVIKANNEAKTAREEVEQIKAASTKAVAKANEEAAIAHQEAERVKATAAKTVAKVNEEAIAAREEAEHAKATSAKAIAKANEEVEAARQDAEQVKATSAKAVAKANEEAGIARQQAELVKTSAEKAASKANEDAASAREEAEQSKVNSAKTVAKANEDAAIARQEAEQIKATAEEAIVRAEEKVRRLDPMQSEFMSNIVHELRAPLHSVLAFTKLLLEGDVSDTEMQKEFLTIIGSQSEHLHKLVSELVDISPIESECFNFGKERIAIKDILQGSIREFYSVAKQKNIVIRDTIPAELPEIEVNSQRMKQVMFNLLDNAVKFSHNGSAVSVSAEVRDDDLLVQVADQGIGIPEEALPFIFEKFYQVKNAGKVGGLGLGLYISKRIIDAHGGSIRVDSTEGAGSTFSFTLPLRQDKQVRL